MSKIKTRNALVIKDKYGLITCNQKEVDCKLIDKILNKRQKIKGCPIIMDFALAKSLKVPIKGSTNIVYLDKGEKLPLGFIGAYSLWEALLIAEESEGETVWIIDGEKICKLAIENIFLNEIYEIIIQKTYTEKGTKSIVIPAGIYEKEETIPFKKKGAGQNEGEYAITIVYVRE